MATDTTTRPPLRFARKDERAPELIYADLTRLAVRVASTLQDLAQQTFVQEAISPEAAKLLTDAMTSTVKASQHLSRATDKAERARIAEEEARANAKRS